MRSILFLPFIAFAACGGQNQVVDARLNQMQREITRLNEAYQSQSQRMSELKDVLDLLKDRLESQSLRQPASALPVVRVRPEQVERPDPPGFFESDANLTQMEDVPTYTDADVAPVSQSERRLPRHPVAPPDNAAEAGNIGVVPITSAPGSVDQTMALYREAQSLQKSGHYAQAISKFKEFAEQSPEHAFADDALFAVGEMRFARAEYAQALQNFHQVVERYPTGNQIPDALLMVGLTQEKMGREDLGRETLSRLCAMFPDTKAAQQAAHRLGATAFSL